MSGRGETAAGDARARPDFVVLGIGNPIQSDDGAGVAAMEAMRGAPAANVRFIDGGTAGPGLLGDLAGCDGLLVLDAVESGGEAGQLVRLDLAAGVGRRMPRTVHELGLETLLQDLRLLGQFPACAVLLGVQPASLAPGVGLSGPVARALPALASLAFEQLAAWRAAWTDGDAAGNAGINARTEDVR